LHRTFRPDFPAPIQFPGRKFSRSAHAYLNVINVKSLFQERLGRILCGFRAIIVIYSPRRDKTGAPSTASARGDGISQRAEAVLGAPNFGSLVSQRSQDPNPFHISFSCRSVLTGIRRLRKITRVHGAMTHICAG
jgi:hypothetical protein